VLDVALDSEDIVEMNIPGSISYRRAIETAKNRFGSHSVDFMPPDDSVQHDTSSAQNTHMSSSVALEEWHRSLRNNSLYVCLRPDSSERWSSIWFDNVVGNRLTTSASTWSMGTR
jgi:hypothetical protein